MLEYYMGYFRKYDILVNEICKWELLVLREVICYIERNYLLKILLIFY